MILKRHIRIQKGDCRYCTTHKVVHTSGFIVPVKTGFSLGQKAQNMTYSHTTVFKIEASDFLLVLKHHEYLHICIPQKYIFTIQIIENLQFYYQ